jgi:hypothetical protein
MHAGRRRASGTELGATTMTWLRYGPRAFGLQVALALAPFILTFVVVPWNSSFCGGVGPPAAMDWADVAFIMPSFASMYWTMSWLRGPSRSAEKAPRSGPALRALMMPLSVCIFVAVVLLAAWVGIFGLTPILCPLNGLR